MADVVEPPTPASSPQKAGRGSTLDADISDVAASAYSSPVSSSSSPSQPHFILDQPILEAIYPSYIIISWSPPRWNTDSSSTQSEAASNMNRVGMWKYYLEWSGTYGADAPHTTSSTTVCHAVIPIEFTNESYAIRIGAKGTLLVSVDQSVSVMVSTKLTVPTRRKSHLPWLQEGAALCPVIPDVLLLASHAASLHDGTSVVWRDTNRPEPQWVGRGIIGTSSFCALRLEYESRQFVAPLPENKVLFVVLQHTSSSAAAASSSSRGGSVSLMSAQSIVEWIRKENHCVIFCGVGTQGSAASMAAHRTLAGLLAERVRAAAVSSPLDASHRDEVHDTARRIYCVTFGSPREDFFSKESLVLAGTAAYSGQFLHYSSCVTSPAKSSGFCDRGGSSVAGPQLTASPAAQAVPTASSSASSLKKGAPSASLSGSTKFLNVPLGVRIGPVFDISTQSWFMRCSASAFERRAEEEEDTQFDSIGALALFDVIHGKCETLAHGIESFTPVVDLIRAAVARTGLTVIITMRGKWIHMAPHILVVPKKSSTSYLGRSATSADIVTISPSQVTARVSLFDILSRDSLCDVTGSSSSETDRYRVDFCVLLTTSAGRAVMPGISLRIPDSIVRLILKPATEVVSQPTAATWRVNTPQLLLTTATSLEPIMASMQTPAGSSFVPFATTKLVCAMENVADLIIANQPKKKETGFFSMVAARVSGSNTSSASAAGSSGGGGNSESLLQPPSQLIVPPPGDMLVKLLVDHIVRRHPARAFFSSCGPWRMKLWTAFPWFTDVGYASKLRQLVDVLVLRYPPKTASGQEHPTVNLSLMALEAMLTTRLMEYLATDTKAFPTLTIHDPLPQHMSFEVFYRTVHPWLSSPFVVSSLAIKTHLELVQEAAALWMVSLVLQLRMTYLSLRLLLVCSPVAGAGAGTVINQLKLLRNDAELAQENSSLTRVTVRRLVAQTLDDALDFSVVGIDVVILFVTELGDFLQPPAQHWLRQAVSRSEWNASTRQIAVLLTKADECLAEFRYDIHDDEFNADAFVTQAKNFVAKKASVGCDPQVLRKLTIAPVALAPSLSGLQRHPCLSRLCSEQIADALRTAFLEDGAHILQQYLRVDDGDVDEQP